MPTNRVARYRTFATRFRSASQDDLRYRLTRIPMAEIERAEAELGARLPASYKIFATEVGVGSFQLLGDAWLSGQDRECPIPLEHVWDPRAIVRQCGEPWLAPIPAELAGGSAVASDVAWKYLLPFGRDGNSDYWHCFLRQSDEADDLPVYVFDSDGGDIEEVSRGLDGLIDRFLGLPTKL